MAIKYTKHAERRLMGRGIPKAWIEASIASPDRQVPDPKDPRLTRAYKRLLDAGGRVLRVVYMKTGSDTLIITAFLDRDAE
jgi:hypothetical protein